MGAVAACAPHEKLSTGNWQFVPSKLWNSAILPLRGASPSFWKAPRNRKQTGNLGQLPNFSSANENRRIGRCDPELKRRLQRFRIPGPPFRIPQEAWTAAMCAVGVCFNEPSFRTNPMHNCWISDKICCDLLPTQTNSERRNRSGANEFSPAERLGRGAYEPPRPGTLGPTDETVSPVSASSWLGDAPLSRCVSRWHDRGLHLYKPAAGADGFDRWSDSSSFSP
jgi:hypothetical protein